MTPVQVVFAGTPLQLAVDAVPLRSRFLAPLTFWVTDFESTLSVCVLEASRVMTTLCHWLSFSGLSLFPFNRLGPFPRSNT